MKTALLLLLLTVVTAYGETPHEVAKRIISLGLSMAPGVINQTEESMNEAAVLVSQGQLVHIMLGETVSEELRVCYAIHCVEERILDIERKSGMFSYRTTKEQLLRDRQTLASYFREIRASQK